MEENNHNGGSKVRKILFNEVSFGIAFIAIVLGVVAWVQNPQQIFAQKLVEIEGRVMANREIADKLYELQSEDIKDINRKLDAILEILRTQK